MAKDIGQETVTYVDNIYKYCVAYKLTWEQAFAENWTARGAKWLISFTCPVFPLQDRFGKIRGGGGVLMRNFLLLMLAIITPAILSGEALKGAVKDSEDTPISSALVLVHWDSAGSTVGLTSNIGIKADLSIQTKGDGTFNIDLPPGFYDVFVAATAFTPTCRKVRIQVGKAQEITLRLNVDPLYIAEMGDRFEVVAPKR